jgi:hypothetical protein
MAGRHALDFGVGELAEAASNGRPDRCREQEGRREQADHEADPAEHLGSLPRHVIGLHDGQLPRMIAAHADGSFDLRPRVDYRLVVNEHHPIRADFSEHQ